MIGTLLSHKDTCKNKKKPSKQVTIPILVT